MAINFKEMFTPATIAAYYTSDQLAKDRRPYMGETLFPVRKKAGLDLAWIKGASGLPVSLMPSAFDAKATFRDRVGVSKIETEMPFFREGYHISERDRQDLLSIGDSKSPYAESVINHIFRDTANLIDGAMVVPERMRMQLLFPINGDCGISLKANDVVYDYKYDTDGSWKLTNYLTHADATKDWDKAATSDPFVDFEAAKQAAENKTGARITRCAMSPNTFRAMAQSQAIKDRFLTVNGLNIGYLTENQVKAIVKDVTGVTIIINGARYMDESKQLKAFVPDGYVSFLPDGALGETWFSCTPEEADLMGSGKASVQIVNTGVAITTELQEHPVNINTFASEIVLPSFEAMDSVVCFKVM